ncbi:MAG: DUF4870 domain-containing protein [Oscillospiraceae bacterium]|nr:DUF4870 domain-containing protein [Oscillospiraceae bacterium]
MNETYFDQSDVQQNKNMVLLAAILQIFIPILFFLPLVCCQNSQYGKFYANQGLLILLMYIATSVVLIIPILGWIASPIIGIATLVFAIMNAVNANKGIRKGIPILGGVELIK